MNAIINTKSNYRNLNGQTLEVIEQVQNRVTCKCFIEEFNKEINIDFDIKEVKIINN